ncbi:MAG: hypothetical protein RSB90_04275 [Eubacterium sp.]
MIQYKLINYAKIFSKKNNVDMLLTGSFCNGYPQEYSDIDIIMVSQDSYLIDEFIGGYGDIIYSTYTVNPEGICIVLYENGVCLDLDLRKSLSLDDIKTAKYLNLEKERIFGDGERVTKLDLKNIFFSSGYNQFIRLFHRTMIKKLSHNNEMASFILNEINEGLHSFGVTNIQWKNNYYPDLKSALTEANLFCKMPHKYFSYLKYLMQKFENNA